MKRLNTALALLGLAILITVGAAVLFFQSYSGKEANDGALAALAPVPSNQQGTPGTPVEWHPASGSRYPMCDAAFDPEAYPKPGMRVIEANTGWLFRQEELSLHYQFPDDEVYPFVSRLTERLSQTGTRLTVLISPPRLVLAREHLASLEGYDRDVVKGVLIQYLNMQRRLQENGALTPDILEEANLQGIPWDQLADPADLHWTPTGAKMTADAIARITDRDPRTKDAQPVKYVMSRVNEPLPVSGYYDILNSICGEDFPFPTIRPFAPPERIASSSALMSEQKNLSAVIAGTSFSALDHRFNFAGFLGESTGLEVVNVSLAGGGPLQALGQYISSGSLERDKPAFLIWEMSPTGLPARDDLNQLNGYLQADCGKPIKATRKFTWGESTLFDSASVVRLDAGPAALTITSDNPALKKFIVRSLNYDGSNKKYDVDFSRTPEPPASYRLQLNSLAGIRAITIEPAGMLSGTIEAELCSVPS